MTRSVEAVIRDVIRDQDRLFLFKHGQIVTTGIKELLVEREMLKDDSGAQSSVT